MFALIVVVLGVILIGRHSDSVRGAAVTIGLLALLEGTLEIAEAVSVTTAEVADGASTPPDTAYVVDQLQKSCGPSLSSTLGAAHERR